MAVTLTATVGSASANTYVTRTEYLAYITNRLSEADLTALGEDEESDKRALQAAALIIDEPEYRGRPLTATQARRWPRTAESPRERTAPGWQYVVESSSGGLYDGRGRFFDGSAIPQPVKDCQCEVALELRRNPQALDFLEFAESGGVSFSAGTVRISEGKTELFRVRSSVRRFLASLILGGRQLQRA